MDTVSQALSRDCVPELAGSFSVSRLSLFDILSQKNFPVDSFFFLAVQFLLLLFSFV